MRHKNRFYNKKMACILVFTLVLIEISSLFLMSKSLLNKEIVLEEVKLKNDKSSMLAILIEQEDGDYIESTDSSWPTNYVFNSEKSGCMNTKGEKIEGALTFDSENNKSKIVVQEAASCYLYFDIKSEAYAIYTESNNTLTFVKSKTPIGETYNGLEVTNVYSGIETTEYATAAEVPWSMSNGISISEIVFEDEIKPKSIAYWFGAIPVTNGHLLNTSDTTNMESAFATVLVGDISYINNLDTSNVTNMKNMFNYAMLENAGLDLSGWNTSNVVDMSGMFQYASFTTIGDISNWNTGSVTNMSNMFAGPVGALDMGNIGKWNTTSVQNMEMMFFESQRVLPLDLSEWNVTNVTNHNNFAMQAIYGTEGILGEEENPNIIQPNWN